MELNILSINPGSFFLQYWDNEIAAIAQKWTNTCPDGHDNNDNRKVPGACLFVCLFVCGVSLTSGQLVNELFPDCTRSCFSQVVLRCRGGDRIYEMRCLFVAVGPNARFIL